MKAILIARVSTEEQREAGNSLPAQAQRLEKYCQNKGFPILKICSFDESAYKTQRDEFDRIIDFILDQKEKVAVCCDKVDRLSRNIFDKRISLLYEKALNDEIELHFVSDGQVINSRISAVEKFQFSMALGLAKYYSDAISDNVKRAQEQKLRKGEWLSKSPVGYKNITRPDGTPDIIINEHQAHIVKTAFALYESGAYSMELLCAKIKSEFGVHWLKGNLSKILKNPFYHGTMIVKGKTYPHRYPTIISKALFDKVQNIKDEFNKKPIKYAGVSCLYRGLLRCADCGSAITPEKHKGCYIYYHCTEFKGKHGAKWIREEEITKQLGEAFKSLQVPHEIMQQIVKTLDSVHQDKMEFHAQQFDTLTSEQKKITKMMDNLYLDKLREKISEDQYENIYQSLRKQTDVISTRLTQLQDAEDNYYITAKYLLDLSNRAYELFASSEMEERRHLIKLVLSNLKLKGQNVLYDTQKPFDLIVKSADGNTWRS